MAWLGSGWGATILAQSITNPGFELGSFPGAGTSFAFAGGTAVNGSQQMPTSWSYAVGLGGVYWVNGGSAHGGSKFLYAWSSGLTEAGNDACNGTSISTGVSANTCYSICAWVADAKADGNASYFTIEVVENGSGSPFHFQRFTLANNPAWSDSASSTIPWQRVCYSFKTHPGTTSLTVYLSASAIPGSGNTSYVVIDDTTVAACGAAACPTSGCTISTLAGNATAVASSSNVTSPSQATGGLSTAGTTATTSNSARLPNTSGTELTLDLGAGVLVPEGDSLVVSLAPDVAQAAVTVLVGPSTSSMTPALIYSRVSETLDILKRVNVVVPSGSGGARYVRFQQPYQGVWIDGVQYGNRCGCLDFGDLPDPTGATASGDYQTYLANSGPRHVLVPEAISSGLRFGSTVDPESDGQPNGTATGDGADEDGVTLPTLTAGLSTSVTVTVANAPSGARLNAFFDWTGDGDFDDANEVLAEQAVANGANLVSVAVPASAVTGTDLGVRFRLSSAGGLGWGGVASDGEIEDYLVQVDSTPTAALVTRVGARSGASGGGAWIRWETGFEAGTLGYRIGRIAPSGTGVMALVPGWVVARNVVPGAAYAAWAPEVREGDAVQVVLTEMKADGTERDHGPFPVVVDAASHEDDARSEIEASSVVVVAARGSSEGALDGPGLGESAAPLPKAVESGRPVGGRFGAMPVGGGVLARGADPTRAAYAKIETLAPGVYYLSTEALAASTGRSPDQLRTWIRERGIGLSEGGEPVSWAEAEGGAGLYFAAEAPSGIYATNRIYWVSGGRQAELRPADLGSVTEAGATWHWAERREEQDRMAVTTLTTDPDGDVWVWGSLVPGNPVFDTRTFTVMIERLRRDVDGETARVEFELMGGGPGTRSVHLAVLGPGGARESGSVTWKGLHAATLRAEFPPGALADGLNRVQLRIVADPASGPGSLAYVQSYRVRYPADAVAVGGVLEVNPGAVRVQRVRGFRSQSVTVWDVTDTRRARRVTSVKVQGDGASFAGDFAVEPGRRYLAFEPSGARRATRVLAVAEPTLARATNRAEYLVLAADALAPAAREWAAYRAGQGLESRVITLGQVADEFGYGHATPSAIRALVHRAIRNWAVPPRYVVLAGRGTVDYRNLEGAHDNLLPTGRVATRYGLFASDAPLVEPEVAVGRLPVTTPEQFRALTRKIREYEAMAGRPGVAPILLVADRTDAAGDFDADARGLATDFGELWKTRVISREEGVSPESFRQQVLGAWPDDSGVVLYLGHGGHDRLGAFGYLTSSDVPQLGNAGPRPPVLVACTCVAGNFAVPGQESLAEVLLREPGHGAIAVLAPTGLTENGPSVHLARATMLRWSKAESGARLGDIVRMGRADAAGRPGVQGILDLYQLLGDPALIVK